jgi:hypothetical protein
MQFYEIGDLISIEGGYYRVIAKMADGRNVATPLSEKEYEELRDILSGDKRAYAIPLPYFEYEIDEY